MSLVSKLFGRKRPNLDEQLALAAMAKLCLRLGYKAGVVAMTHGRVLVIDLPNGQVCWDLAEFWSPKSATAVDFSFMPLYDLPVVTRTPDRRWVVLNQWVMSL